MSLQNSYVEVLAPSVVVFGDEAITKKLGLDEIMRVGRQDGIVPLEEDKPKRAVFLFPSYGCKRRMHCLLARESSCRKPAMLAPCLWTYSLQNHEKITFCCFSHQPVCGILLRQLELIQWYYITKCMFLNSFF